MPAHTDGFSVGDDPEIKEFSQNSDLHSTLLELNQDAINDLRNEEAASALEHLKRAE